MFDSSTYDSLISTRRRHILCFHTPPEITQPLIVAYGYEDVKAKFDIGNKTYWFAYIAISQHET